MPPIGLRVSETDCAVLCQCVIVAFVSYLSFTYYSPAHSFYLCKLDIEEVIVLDYYGGPHFVSKEEYFNAGDDDIRGIKLLDLLPHKYYSKTNV